LPEVDKDAPQIFFLRLPSTGRVQHPTEVHFPSKAIWIFNIIYALTKLQFVVVYHFGIIIVLNKALCSWNFIIIILLLEGYI
jgi:hypothetical protein